MTEHVFALSALGGFPAGPAHPDARDYVLALLATGNQPVVQTEARGDLHAAAKEWLRAQGLEGMRVEGRDDKLPAPRLDGYFGQWLRKRVSRAPEESVCAYFGSMEEIEALAAELGDAAGAVSCYHVTPAAIHRVMT